VLDLLLGILRIILNSFFIRYCNNWKSLIFVAKRFLNDKILSLFKQGNMQAMLLVHSVPSIFRETFCSRIHELQEENVA